MPYAPSCSRLGSPATPSFPERAPELEDLDVCREPELGGGRELVAGEPAQLLEIVARRRLAARDRRQPGDAEHRAPLVGLEPEPEQLADVELETGLLQHLAPKPVERVLALVEKPAGEVPASGRWIVRPPAEEHPVAVADHGLCARHRVPPGVEPARVAGEPVSLDGERGCAPGAEPPPVEDPHHAIIYARPRERNHVRERLDDG